MIMTITAISNALPVKNSQVAFSGKNEENKDNISYPKKMSTLKSVPVVVLMAMTPSMLNAVDTNNGALAELNSSGAVELYESAAVSQPNIIASKTVGTHTVNLISVDGDDRNFEEIEYIGRSPQGVMHRGIIKAVMFTQIDESTPSVHLAGLALPKDDTNNYNINDVDGAKMMQCMIAGKDIVPMIKSFLDSQGNSANVTICTKTSPRKALMPVLNSEIQKYKNNHNLR